MVVASPVFCVKVEDLVDQLNTKYSSFEDIKMDFTQSISSSVFENKREFKGKLYIKNPDKFRVETPLQSIVTNGQSIWVYSEENKQVTKNRLDPKGGILLPYRYLSSFRDEYKARLDQDEQIKDNLCYKLILTPKDENSFISKMIVWIDKDSLLTLKLRYWDLSDNEVTFLFENIKINSQIDNSKFVFEIPPGIEFLDLSR
jgi:outer membrane lipoprotein carrier protein